MVLHESLISLLSAHPHLVLGICTFLGSAGVPLPTSMLVMVAGVLAAKGQTTIWLVIFTAALGAVLGDCLGYLMGKHVAKLSETQPGHLARLLDQGRGSFATCRTDVVFTSRFLLTPLIIPVNLLSGVYGCAGRSFLPYVVAGELVWAVEMGGLGYLFGESIDHIQGLLGNVTVAAFIFLGLWYVVKRYGWQSVLLTWEPAKRAVCAIAPESRVCLPTPEEDE